MSALEDTIFSPRLRREVKMRLTRPCSGRSRPGGWAVGHPRGWRRQPTLPEHLPGQLAVEVRPDQRPKGERSLLVFIGATFGPRLRQVSLVHKVAEQLGIGAVSDAQHVVEALRGGAVLVGDPP